MSGILVVAEHDGGTFKPTASELIGKAAALAAELGTTVSAAVLGDAPAAELGGFGASTVYQASGDFSSYDTGATTDALAAIIREAQPDFVLAPSSFSGREVLPRLAARFDGEMASGRITLSKFSSDFNERPPATTRSAVPRSTPELSGASVSTRVKPAMLEDHSTAFTSAAPPDDGVAGKVLGRMP